MSTRVVDIHAHLLVQAVEALVAESPERAAALRQQAEAAGVASTQHNRQLFATEYLRKLTDIDTRLAQMDAMGVDMQAVSLSPTQYYYWADRDLAQAIALAANEHLAELSATHPDRFVGLCYGNAPASGPRGRTTHARSQDASDCAVARYLR